MTTVESAWTVCLVIRYCAVMWWCVECWEHLSASRWPIYSFVANWVHNTVGLLSLEMSVSTTKLSSTSSLNVLTFNFNDTRNKYFVCMQRASSKSACPVVAEKAANNFRGLLFGLTWVHRKWHWMALSQGRSAVRKLLTHSLFDSLEITHSHGSARVL